MINDMFLSLLHLFNSCSSVYCASLSFDEFYLEFFFFFFFQAEDGIRDWSVTGVQTCALPISLAFVKAHKCTNLARRQAAAGHELFTCATIRECEGMAAAGLRQDLLLANEVLHARRIWVLIAGGARVTLAIYSPQTIEAAAAGGGPPGVIHVNVGLP